MAALMNALDTQKQLGTNGHAEYKWTNANATFNTLSDLKENIVQFSFQLVRGANLNTMSSKFKDILQILSCNIKRDETVTEAKSNEVLSNEAKSNEALSN